MLTDAAQPASLWYPLSVTLLVLSLLLLLAATAGSAAAILRDVESTQCMYAQYSYILLLLLGFKLKDI